MPRRRDPTLWFNVPGVVAAYQPVAAPDPLLARYNVGSDARMAGRYTAVPGVAPTWSSATGWMFNGSTQYLRTGVVPFSSYSLFCQFKTIAGVNALVRLQGASGDTTSYFGLYPNYGGRAYYSNGYQVAAGVESSIADGNMGVSGYTGYKNGVFAVSITAGGTIEPNLDLWFGCGHDPTGAVELWNGYIKAVVIISRVVSPSEAQFIARQMTYCHVNPDWSAWCRRRRYSYRAPVVIETGSARSALGGAWGAAGYPGAPHAGHSAATRPGVAVAGASGTIRSTAAAGGHTAIVQRPTAPDSGNQGKRND